MENTANSRHLSRRRFMQQSAVAATAAAMPNISSSAPLIASGKSSGVRFMELHRSPDLIRVYAAGGDFLLHGGPGSSWTGQGIRVTTPVTASGMDITLSASQQGVSRIHLRWNSHVPPSPDTLYLGDAWERAYGELSWRPLEVGRVMPWYFIASNNVHSHCYGIMTAPSAFCFWMIDEDGISLWADVRSGGSPLQLGGRELKVASVVTRASKDGETAFQTLHAFCMQMCPKPRLSNQPIFGHNDWDYYYGAQTAESTLDVARTIVALTPSGLNRPYIVIDDGWEGETMYAVTRGPWDHGNPKFPDMPGLASKIKMIGGRPGLWIRPTSAWEGLPDEWRLTRSHDTLDPTVPEAKQQMVTDIARLRQWGFELVKPDFLTVDIMGRYGFNMGADLTDNGWTFREGPVRTTAEVVLDLYQAIRDAAGEMIVLGCNTFSHLAAGLFEAARIGDDTSGTNWERTRKMGVNCLSFRSAQNRAFYAVDPDIVPITKSLPWQKSKQWLDLVSSSAAVLFVSIDISVMGPQQTAALRNGLASASQQDRLPLAVPLDWMSTNCPSDWMLKHREEKFDWILAEGVSPFPV
jgi:alpha-galactosidase